MPGLGLGITSRRAKGTPGLYDFTKGMTPPSYSRAGSATALRKDGTVASFPANTARRTDRGLLIEDTATNLIPTSLYITSQAGTGSAPVVTANAAMAPDGTNSAMRVILDLNAGVDNGDSSQLYWQVGNADATPYTLSFWVRADSPQSLLVRHVGDGGYTTVNITTTWQRVTITETASVANWYVVLSKRGSYSNGRADFYMWGVQLEAGSRATSYIPTTTATATRSLDVPSLPISVGDTGAFLLDFDYTEVEPLWKVLFATNIDASNRSINFYVSPGGGPYCYYAAGGNALWTPTVGITLGDRVRAVIAWNNGTLYGTINGVDLPTWAYSGGPFAFNQITLGQGYTDAAYRGYIRSFRTLTTCPDTAARIAMTTGGA